MFKSFERYNDTSSYYEELSILYDGICAQARSDMEEDDAKVFTAALSSGGSIPVDFSEKDIDNLLDEIREWLNCKFDTVSERTERNLLDCTEYGENIIILGVNCRVYILSLDELHGTPETGSEEQTEVSLLLDKEALARGYVKSTVGYLDFDEDGGASGGIEDSIDYEVDDVLGALKDLISDLKEKLVNEQELASPIENCLK